MKKIKIALRTALLPFLFAGLAAVPATALAQDDLPPPPDDGEVLAPPPDEADDVPAAPADNESEVINTDSGAKVKKREVEDSEQPAQPKTKGKAESADQQDLKSDETIYVIEDKPFLTGGHFEFSPQLVMSFNDRFTNHYGFLFTGMYYLRENVGVQLSGGYLFGFPSEITNEIREKGRLAPEPVDLYSLTWTTTADVQWSPIYGKVSVLDMVLGQYSMYFSVGAGMTGLSLERYFDSPGDHYKLDWPMAFTSTVGVGLRVFFLDWLGARVEIRDYVQANTVDKTITNFPTSYFDVQNYYMLQAGATFLF